MATELETYRQDRTHTRHCPGVPEAPEWSVYWRQRQTERLHAGGNRLPSLSRVDAAWVVMFHEQGLIPTATAQTLFPVLEEGRSARGWGGENWIRERLGEDVDEAVVSAVNYGRTLQEPMYRMMMRDAILWAIDEVLPTLQTLLDVADANLDTLMAGHSHWAQAQPTTYAQYLLALHDGLVRGLDQLALAYRHTNQNSAGCGASSGTGWPTDRDRITELLGFDELVEVAYDCEASQDNIVTTCFAAANLAITLSRAALDFNVWLTEEWNLFEMDMSWRGVSSFMPHKANAGNKLEHVRIATNEVLCQMQRAVYSFKNEPVQDILPVYGSKDCAVAALAHLEGALGTFRNSVKYARPNRDRMRRLVESGYSGSPDLVVHLVREKGWAGRAAHRISATMVRLARERGIAPADCTGALLDEAARVSGDPEPHLTDAEVQGPMRLEGFLEKHANPGDPNPARTGELVEARRLRLDALRQTQADRKERIAAGYRKLDEAIEGIMKLERASR